MTPRASKFVVYLRVSTAQQGASGLGLEAQQNAVGQYLASVHGVVVGSYTEIESGTQNARPQLLAALKQCRLTGATLLIAKLDRLSRNAGFLLTLRDGGVKLVAADMPEANELLVGVMALIAQHEREAISKRTKEALAAAKARGQVLGNPNGARALLASGKVHTAGMLANQLAAAKRTEDKRELIEDLRARGYTTLGAIAEQLNAMDMPAPRGGLWGVSSVRLLLQRLDARS